MLLLFMSIILVHMKMIQCSQKLQVFKILRGDVLGMTPYGLHHTVLSTDWLRDSTVLGDAGGWGQCPR